MDRSVIHILYANYILAYLVWTNYILANYILANYIAVTPLLASMRHLNLDGPVASHGGCLWTTRPLRLPTYGVHASPKVLMHVWPHLWIACRPRAL